MDLVKALGSLLNDSRLGSGLKGARERLDGSPKGAMPPAAASAPPATAGVPGPCPCCEGKGAFDLWARPCEPGHMHEKMKCPTCHGQRTLPNAAQWRRCPRCEGKGAFNHWDRPCLQCDMHFKSACSECGGTCYFPPPAPNAAPVAAPPPAANSGLGAGSPLEWLGGLLGAALGGAAPTPAARPPVAAEANDQAALLIRAMLNAARCDGRIDAQEQARLFAALRDVDDATRRFLEQELARPCDMEGFAASVPLGLEEQVYTVSLGAIEVDSAAELDYLRRLARALRLSPMVVQLIHQRLGQPAP